MRSVPAVISIVLASQFIVSCGVPQEEHERTLAEIDSLRTVIDELEHGAQRLLNEIETAAEQEDFRTVLSISNSLSDRHPGSEEASAGEKLAEVASQALAEAEAEKQREAERRRREAEAKARQLEQRREAALASLWKTTDEIEGTTWYYDRASSRYVNSTSRVVLYMGRSNGSRPSLFFRVNYKADDWLFLNGFTFRVDDETFRISGLGFGDVERDNGYGGIWEWYSTRAGPSELRIARAIADSRSAVIRYHGDQYHRDRTITQTEKRGLSKVLDAYDTLSDN